MTLDILYNISLSSVQSYNLLRENFQHHLRPFTLFTKYNFLFHNVSDSCSTIVIFMNALV